MAGRKTWDPRRGNSIAIKINAGNDRNGNPRRGWVIIQVSNGEPVDFVDEGYRGSGALKDSGYSDLIVGPTFVVTPGEYRYYNNKISKGLGNAMAGKSVWHTDIVVNGQGFNVKIEPVDSHYEIMLKPDTPGSRADEALDAFMRQMGAPEPVSSARLAKDFVEGAIAGTGAEWNGWHRESY